MKKSSPPKKNKPPRAAGCSWDDEDSALLLTLLIEQKEKGLAAENGFKMSTFMDVAGQLEAKRPSKKVAKTGLAVKGHFAKVSPRPPLIHSH